MPSIANISSNFLPLPLTLPPPANDVRLSYIVNQVASSSASASASAFASASASAAVAASTSSSPILSSSVLPAFSPPRIESLVASSAEDLNSFGGDVTFDIFDDDDDLFGSPMAFDASEQGLWNGRFVPPPPRPPFFVDEPMPVSDGLTTCDLCSWAMPTKSTFMFEGTIEKATELGWPLTLIIVSVLSALLGAIIMIAVVRCRRKKSSNNRNDTHVQWWSRNKRAHGHGGSGIVGGVGGGAGVLGGSGSAIAGSSAHNNNNSSNNNNHLRRSNIYTAHPADSIRGLQPLPLPLPMPMSMPMSMPMPMPMPLPLPLPLPLPPTQPTLAGNSGMSMSPSAMGGITAATATAAAAAAATGGMVASAPPSSNICGVSGSGAVGGNYFHPYHHAHHHPHVHAHAHAHAHTHPHQHHHQHHHHQQHAPLYPHDCDDADDGDEDAAYEEPEYHQPQQQQLRPHSSSSMSSVTSSPSPVPTTDTVACHWPQASTSAMVIAS